MGSEDFSRVLAEVPGAFVFLGACAGDDPATAPTNHSARARFDESVLPDAALLLAELALAGSTSSHSEAPPVASTTIAAPPRMSARLTSKALLRTCSSPASPAGQRHPLDRADEQRAADHQAAQPPGPGVGQQSDHQADHTPTSTTSRGHCRSVARRRSARPSPPRPGPQPSRCSARSTTLVSSMARVIGPTPPGTGATQAATSRTPGSTSPTSPARCG